MFGIGTGELLLVLVIALIVLGPERMPKMARDLGRVMGDLRRTSDELRNEFLNADKIVDVAARQGSSQSEPTPAPLIAGAGEGAPGSGATPPATPQVAARDETRAAGSADETPFDREMREARERLRAAREATE